MRGGRSARTTRPASRTMTPAGTRVRGWVLVPAVVAPVAMIGGWLVAEAARESFDPVRETISALAATTAQASWVMTAGLVLTGVAHVATAAGLRAAAPAGRVVHAVGGIATVAVAAFPVDVSPVPHGVAAAVAFGALALWPALGTRRGEGTPAVLRPRVGVTASLVLLGALGAFVATLQGAADAVGLSERVLAAAQALWPLVVVLGVRRAR